MRTRKVKNFIFILLLTVPFSGVEIHSMDGLIQAARTQNYKRIFDNSLTNAEVGTLVQNYNTNLLDDTKRFINDKPKSIPVQGFLDLSIKEPKIPYEERRDAAIAGKYFTDHSISEPTPEQKAAALHLFRSNQEGFSQEDLDATIYLQTNNAGQGQLGVRVPEPTLPQVQGAKLLIALSILPFTQEDLDVTVHLQTDPGNALDGPIPNPTKAEILAAKMLKQQSGTFTTEALHNQVRTNVTDRLRPLACESRILEVRHAGRRYVEIDIQADQLVYTTPEVLHQQLWNDYEAFKAETVPSPEDIDNGLAERRQLARRLFS